MKHLFLNVFLIFTTILICNCQTNKKVDLKSKTYDTINMGEPVNVFIGIDKYISLEPQFPIGENGLDRYLYQKVEKLSHKYEYKTDSIIVLLDISENGKPSITSIESQNHCKTCMDATKEIIDSMPYWIPSLEYDSSINAYRKINGTSAIELHFQMNK